MTKLTGKKTTTRRQHTPEFLAEALALAEKVGVAKAARELGLHDSQLYGWRTRARAAQDRSEGVFAWMFTPTGAGTVHSWLGEGQSFVGYGQRATIEWAE